MDTQSMLPYFIAAHLAGDFLLQNNWMASNKARSHVACAAHVATYLLPFIALVALIGAPWLSILLVGAQHYAQDRYALHLRWMTVYGQTPPDKWPVGPMCVDQAMHIAWMAAVLLCLG